jgi:hypothetical protein
MSDYDSNADCCICGKYVHVFNDLDREVNVNGWHPEGATKSLQIMSAALGCTILETGKTVILIVHQIIFSPSLNHNFLCTMHTILHEVFVSESQKFQCMEPTELSHTISMRGYDVVEVLNITLELHGALPCFPTIKPTQEEFHTCDRYELIFESPEYDPSAKTFSKQEYSTNITGYLNLKRRQVCTLLQKEMKNKKLAVNYSNDYAKLQYLYINLDDSSLLEELNLNPNISYLTLSTVIATMRDGGGVL